jgi:tetratricopeptide (TPR) repeat protein
VELVLEAKLALACNLIFLMDAAAAEALVREVVAGCERVYGPHHEETLRALQCLWLWCYVFGYSDECLEISDRRMEIVRTSPRPLDYVSFQIKAESAVMLQKRRHEVAAAETLAREAVAEGLATRNRTIGVAFSHFALGNSLAARGELAAAEECLRAAVDVLAAASGETASLEFREVLGECVSMQSGREDEGLEMMRSAVDSARAQMGQDSPRAAFMLSSLARRLWNSDRLEEAEERYREYFAMLRRGNHPAIQTHAQNLHDFGRVLLQRGKSAEAERVLRDGLELAGRFSRDQWLRHDWDDRLLLSALAQSLQAQGKDSEAEPVYAQIRERAKDPRKPWEVERLAAELRQLGRAAEADAIGAAD